ncbi:MAG: benzoate--CoA ligase [Gemmatimonadota bacterium]|nr:MAG: benzoate--CoA ligase [Gemmatimonadota bacterium]
MTFKIPAAFQMADYFLDARVREGRGDRVALRGDFGSLTYRDVQSRANRFAHLLKSVGVEPEQRVLIALPDGPEFVAAFFATLKLGAVVVMVNPELKADAIEYFLEYTRASVAVIHSESRSEFLRAAGAGRHLKDTIVVGEAALDTRLAAQPDELENFPSHRDDAAVWLFSGGTTGKPKAVVQTHASFANTTELYAKGVLKYSEDDVTLSVPKLFFGYATGSNLLFPFSVGACAVLFPDRCTPACLFGMIARYRPTILINVPTMIQKLVSHEAAAAQDLSCLRLSTSAGEALPVELHDRWKRTFGVEILDGLGTAEMWHIFLTNRPGRVHPGTIGEVVPGFEVKVCDDDGHQVADGETGWLWVRGQSRAQGYWQQHKKTCEAFRGEWYVSGDMVQRSSRGVFTYCGRGDDMLKVSGKWLAPSEVENCLLQHPAVREVAVIGAQDRQGLMKPHAFVVAAAATAALPVELQTWVREHLEPYKYPRAVTLLEALPRTHLGKADRGKLRRMAEEAQRADV